MMVNVPTKDVGEVKDKFGEVNVKRTLEDGNEEYIKGELGIDVN